MKIELEYIEKLVKLAKDNDLTELSVEEGEKAIIIKKEKVYAPVQAMSAVQQVEAPAQVHSPALLTDNITEEVKSAKKGVAITSPMVGTFYGASNPDSEPFTAVGKTVSVGQVVCIIEAMKLMNEIESEVSGKVLEVLVQDGQPVEYGQTIMIIDPS